MAMTPAVEPGVAAPKVTYLTLLLRPATLVMLLGQFVSTAGDWLYTIAALWLSYQITGSTVAMSGVALATVLSSLVAGFFGGALIDRWHRLRTLVSLDLIRAVLVAALPLLYFQGWLSPWLLAGFGFVLSFLHALFWPTLQSSLPEFARNEGELRGMNGIVDFTNRMGRVAGPGLAALAAAIPLVHFFTLDAISFAVSGLAFLLILRRWPESIGERARQRAKAEHKRITASEIFVGFRHVTHDGVLRIVFAVRGLNNVAWGFYFIGAPV